MSADVADVHVRPAGTAAWEFYAACGFDTEHVLLEMELDD